MTAEPDRPVLPGVNEVTALAPASVANVAVGFDVLGHALLGLGDRVRARRVSAPGVRITGITGVVTDLPLEPERNTAGVAVLALLDATRPGFGVELSIEKGIPLGSGLGGSAASAVAAVVAVNALLAEPLGQPLLLDFALAGEMVASGARHADNAAASLFGGLVLVSGGTRPRVTRIPVPDVLRAVVVHPHLVLSTRSARAVLRPTLSLEAFVRQSANLGGFIAACHTGDLDLLRAVFEDVIVEPQRRGLIPGFDPVQRAARAAGALGCSISGAGPSVFAWVEAKDAPVVGGAMQAAFAAHGLASDLWVSPIGAGGADVVPE